jgi:hypothetical protein
VRGNNEKGLAWALRAARKNEARRQFSSAADDADALLSSLAMSASYNNVPPSRAGGVACAVQVGATDNGNAAIDLFSVGNAGVRVRRRLMRFACWSKVAARI